LLATMPASSLPDSLLSKATVERLFQSHCAACHGQAGGGDGALAAQLAPPPTDFTDKERALNRSLLGLYDAISNGIDDTPMPAFSQLTEQQRWSLAFHIGGLPFQPDSAAEGKASNVTLRQLVDQSPAQLTAEHRDITLQEIERLRANPESLFAVTANPLQMTRNQLLQAQQAYQRSDYRAAQALAVSAYLDGFELVENSLDARDKSLRHALEADMMEIRQLLKQAQPAGVVETLMNRTLTQLDDADRLLYESTLSNATLFSASLVILLREGLEALLVVIALVTVLTRMGRQDGLRYVHLGWVTALMAGVATWAVAQSLISISGANREVMEGIAALMAAMVLLYVGIWMHSKTHAAQWQAYIQQHINTHLTSGTLWGLALLAFIAVYREVFETVLFYQALLTQAVPTQYPSVFAGLILGVALLAISAWVLVRYSVKLPIARFFSITTYLLLGLAFILMGKAVSALQEAALIGITPLPLSFEIEWIGVKSTWQGTLAQLSVLLVFLIFMLAGRSGQKVSATKSRNVTD
jgi:high-affinity iron transporter